MGQTIVKPNRDENFYILWSSIVEAPLAWGTKEDFQTNPPWPEDNTDFSDERFDRVDRTSTSARYYVTSWDEEDTYIYEQRGWIERSRLKEITDILEREESVPNDHPEILALLHPFEEDEL
jgi:hypothetical protein